MPSGETVYKYTLTNHHGVSADFITLGGTWVTMNVPDKKGKIADMITWRGICPTILILAQLSEETPTVSGGQ